MKKINFYGRRISFSVIVLLFVSIYFALNVFADTECRDYEEYCSGLANGGQTTVYTRGGYCYYKVEVGGNDNNACQVRWDDKNKKCWTTVGTGCNANEECTATGCKPRPLSSTKPGGGSDNVVVTKPEVSCGNLDGWCTGSSTGLVLPSMDFGRGLCNYPIRDSRGDVACSYVGQDKKCWKMNSETCKSPGVCTIKGCCVSKWEECDEWSECRPGIAQSRKCRDVNKCNPLNLEKTESRVCSTIQPPTPPKVETVTPITGEGVIESGVADRNYAAEILCPSGRVITELQAYYYCLDLEDKFDRDKSKDANAKLLGKSKFCSLNSYGGLGLNVGGVGSSSVRYTFSNEICEDPCSGFVKKGKLIARCVGPQTPNTQIPGDKESGEKVSAMKGDFDNSGCVDMNDFNLFKENFGKAVVSETKKYDLDSDNDIDFDDLLDVFAGNFGKGNKCGTSTKFALPKPASKVADVLECTPNKRADFSKNRIIDFDDFFLFAEQFDKQVTKNNENFDLDDSGKTDFEDFFIFALEFGRDVCKEVLGDGAKSNLNNCNEKCDDVDGCGCLNSCVYNNVEQGQTCGGKKEEEKSAVEKIVETVRNIFVEPNHCEDGTQDKDEEYVDCGGKDCKKCLDIKEKSKTCRNLGYGDKCEVEFNVKVNAGKGSGVNLPVVFEYKGKKISKDSVLAVSGVKSNPEIPAVTGSTVWDVGFTDVTGNVVQDTTTGSSSRFNCVLKNRPEICCPFGFRVSSQDSSKCVRDEVVVIPKKSLYDRFLELAQKYLSAKGEEKEGLRNELRGLE